MNIWAALTDETPAAVVEANAGKLFGYFKQDLAEIAVDKLAPISTEMGRLMEDTAEIYRILARGAERARELSEPILKQTYEIVGMVR